MRIAVVSLLVVVVSGCATVLPSKRLGYFTVASSFNVRHMEYGADESVKVSGEDCVRRGVTPSDSRIQRAMDAAIRNGQENNVEADLLVNVRIDHTFPVRPVKDQFFKINIPTPFDCIEVSGDLVKLQNSERGKGMAGD